MMLRLAIVCVVLLVTASVARAQDTRGLDTERFSPALDGASYLSVQATTTPGHLNWNAQLTTSWAHRPLTARNLAGDVLAIVDHRTTATLAMQLGLGERGAIAFAAPIVLWQDRGQVALPDGPVARTAFGDPRLSLRYRLFGEVVTDRIDRPDGPGLAMQIVTALPLGSRDAFVGESLPRVSFELLGEFRLLGLGIAAKLGYRHRFAERAFLDARFAGEVEASLGAQAPLPWVRNLSAVLEVRSLVGVRDAFSRPTTAVEAAIGARYRVGDLLLTTSVAFGLTPAIGVPSVRPVVDLSWAPRRHDQDADGIVDADDLCPPLAEDFDGFEDEDGCPDPDNDNDLIPDEDDECPLEAAEEGRDDNEDGCTDM